MQKGNFFINALSDNGQPSSKRLVGFLIIIFTMVMYAFKGMDYEFFVTWLGSGLVSLGISGIEKFVKQKPNN